MNTTVISRVSAFLSRAPLASSAIQITSRYVSGVQVAPKDGTIRAHFILPLDEGLVNPSFAGKNIIDPDNMTKVLNKGVQQLNANGRKVAFLIPDVCQRTFVFSFDTLPGSRIEKERLLLFRIKKQMPMLVEDARLSFVGMKTPSNFRVVASIARNSVIREYEGLLSACGLDTTVVGVPIFGLFNLLDWPGDKNILLINMEENSLSLIAVVKGVVVLSRQKSSILPVGERNSLQPKIHNIIQEIENTVNFLEDHEQTAIDSLRVRIGMLEGGKEVFRAMKESLGFPVKDIGDALNVPLESGEKVIIAPLLGQTR